MKKDGEIKLLLNERGKGASQKLAAARADVCERTARKYEKAGKLPSQMKRPRTHRTRENPFVGDWAWVESQIRDDPALQTKTLFALLCAAFPADQWSNCPLLALRSRCSIKTARRFLSRRTTVTARAE